MADGATPLQTKKRMRDPRLDLARGLTMLVIFMAHVPSNPWNDFIWARFGFSSGTELFFYCSGFASAIAFGSVFVKSGFGAGTAKIAWRIAQVYRAHIGLTLALLLVGLVADRLIPGATYVDSHFDRLLLDPATGLLSLLTLTHLPAYLDILPVYLVILALVPVVMALSRLHPLAPFALILSLYLAVWTMGLNLPANPWNGEGWYLNPFAWPLVFFTGFAVAMKWLPVPALNQRWLLTSAIAFVIAAIPLAWPPLYETVASLGSLHDLLLPANEKSWAHPLRLLHFLALAYIVLSLCAAHLEPIARSSAGRVLLLVGRHSLACFIASMVIARIAGILLDLSGRDVFAVATINVVGLILIIAVAAVMDAAARSPVIGAKGG